MSCVKINNNFTFLAKMGENQVHRFGKLKWVGLLAFERLNSKLFFLSVSSICTVYFFYHILSLVNYIYKYNHSF